MKEDRDRQTIMTASLIVQEIIQPEFGLEGRPQGANYTAHRLKGRVRIQVFWKIRDREARGAEELGLTR